MWGLFPLYRWGKLRLQLFFNLPRGYTATERSPDTGSGSRVLSSRIMDLGHLEGI